MLETLWETLLEIRTVRRVIFAAVALFSLYWANWDVLAAVLGITAIAEGLDWIRGG